MTAFYRRIEHIVLVTFVTDYSGLSALSCHHALIEFCHCGIAHTSRSFLYGLLHHQALHWANDKLSRTRNHNVVGRRIDVLRIDIVVQPIE